MMSIYYNNCSWRYARLRILLYQKNVTQGDLKLQLGIPQPNWGQVCPLRLPRKHHLDSRIHPRSIYGSKNDINRQSMDLDRVWGKMSTIFTSQCFEDPAWIPSLIHDSSQVSHSAFLSFKSHQMPKSDTSPISSQLYGKSGRWYLH